MYAEPNFKTKKALKEAVAAGKHVTVFQPNDMFGKTQQTLEQSVHGPVKVTLEGPHYPKPHRWYAQVVVANGRVVEVK